MRRRWLGLLMTSFVALAPLAACGDDDTTTEPTDAATSGDEGAFPVSIDNEGGEVTIAARPERIVSLSATATEMLFAIGAGDQVTAVDEFSDYPPEAPTTDLSGFEPNVEAIAS
ncbi:MAG: ABC transporter substrate-binding protein, partial [Acidimicrobiales bacterium]